MMLPKLQKAIRMATAAHSDHVDRNGVPYIYHLFYVSDKQATVEGKIVGLLHDSVEDGKLTLDEIRFEFGDQIATWVDAMTRKEGESYSSYINRVMEHEVTMYIKISDIEHNTLLERVDAKAAKRFPMYKEAYDMICERLGLPNRFYIPSNLIV